MALHLAPVTADNLDAVLAVSPEPGVPAHVAPVERSLAEAYVHPTAWPRAIVDGDEVVGFVMMGFDPDNEIPVFRGGIWRLNVDDGHQGKGYGRFAVEQVAAEARARGYERISVLWVPAPDGPEGFYLRVGFVPTGETLFGQRVGVLDLGGPAAP